MAHQTFYIDIDEEITSIVERLRRARASEIILVVPKRALLIQSIVNLRILKREADEARLQLMMVTQDKLGKILIEKAGIFVQQKMDNISDEEIELKEESPSLEKYETGTEVEKESIISGKNRLDKIGSDSYFDEKQIEDLKRNESINLEKEKFLLTKKKTEKEELINKELVLRTKKNPEMKLLATPSFDLKPATPAVKAPPIVKAEVPMPAPASRSFVGREGGDNFQDKKIENFFYQPNAIERQSQKVPSKNYDTYSLPVKVHKWFWVFGVVTVLLAAGIATYLLVPKAVVVVSVRLDSQSVDSQMTGKVGLAVLDVANGTVPAKEVSSAQEVSGSYDATGSELVSNQKAHGKVTIYNEFSSSPQPLVATTRFLTADGKLFRLASGVTVPGTAVVDGQTKSGEVEAEIVADSSGDSYNIGPSTFNIPGFKSSGTKYDKIYAKSATAFTSGGNGAAESKVITDNDIASAKNKILTMLNSQLEEAMKKSGGEDTVILDGAMNESDVTYKISNSTGDVADSFQITASANAKAIVISQKDMNSVLADALGKKAGAKKIDISSIKTDFSRSDVDFANGTISIRFHTTGKIIPDFTTDTIKKAILGKNEEQIKAYLSDLSNIEKVEVNYWPSFINGRVPVLSGRVNVSLDPI
ncbi:MAG: hypothetical protein WC022_00620 [Parcubacteria group bacterium]